MARSQVGLTSYLPPASHPQSVRAAPVEAWAFLGTDLRQVQAEQRFIGDMLLIRHKSA